MEVEITMAGRPVPWARAAGKGRRYTPPKQRKHRKDMALLFFTEACATGAERFVGPVAVVAVFSYGKNTHTWVKASSMGPGDIDLRNSPGTKGFELMTGRPDLDNLVKQVLEALQDSGLVKDDSQVAAIVAVKVKQ